MEGNLFFGKSINLQGDIKGGEDETNQSNLHYYLAIITCIFSPSRRGCKYE